MAKLRSYKLGALNLKVSPLIQKEGDFIRCINVETSPFGAKKKRPGYITYLGTMPNGSTVTNLFNWTKADGTTFWNYAVAGGVTYYSAQGTGAWTNCGNGTFTSGSVLGNAVLNETLMVGDNVGTIRYTTSGTNFVTLGTSTPAPVGNAISQYQNRIYVGGTGSVLTYSVTGDPTNWNTSGTSDSNSLTIPGAGKINQHFVASDMLIVNKNSGIQYRWDGFSLIQAPTNKGLSAPQSLGSIEDLWFYLNRDGFYTHDGDRPKLLSNAIEKQIYNNANNGISGSSFDIAAGASHRYQYYCGVGTISDDLTYGTINNCVEVFDYRYNEWSNYSFNDNPNAWLSFKDNALTQQFIFASGNQCYQFSGTANSDNGAPITAIMEGMVSYQAPESDKEWKFFWAMFNPGCQAKVAVAMSDTFTSEKKNWVDLGDASDGVYEFHFPEGSRSKLLFWKVYESSRSTRFDFYGISVEATILDKI